MKIFKTRYYLSSLAVACLLIVLGTTVIYKYWPSEYQVTTKEDIPIFNQEDGPSRAIMKQARMDYYFRLLRDPETNQIPKNIRSRELGYARQLPTIDFIQQRKKRADPSFQAVDFTWNSAGPSDLGGRTRALGIDQRNPDIIIAGAVSGGIWKSTNGGTTWELKTTDSQHYSVTSLAQDPTSQDTWYYGSGEFINNSASDRGFTATYFGTGIFKSTDNGETWDKLPNTNDEDTSYNTEFDFISRIEVAPSGTVFFSSNGFGVYRSVDDGQTFSGPVVGSEGNQIYSDVAAASSGRIAATISQASFGAGNTNDHNPGIFISNDDGVAGSWEEVTPNSFPSTYRRSVLSFAPSNPDILYVLTHVSGSGTSEDNRLFKIDLGSGTSIELSDNIPDFGGEVGGFWTQGGYDMEIAVKPDDEDFVLIGGTNLFRGREGFTRTSNYTDSDKDEYWIGGYNKQNNINQYPNQHPDQHVIAFDPNDPDRMWTGHDGGVSVTENVTANSVSWSDMNNSYITTQFYAIAIPSEAGDERLMGGTQDNGTPFFRFNSQQSQNTSNDISSGDGGYSYFTDTYLFVSRQEGSIVRYNADLSSGNPIEGSFAFVHPANASNQLFVHPYVVDPSDESIMYYPGGRVIWRNTSVNLITNTDADGATMGWEQLNSVNVPSDYIISSLTVSRNPANILYYAGYSNNARPVTKRLRNANSATTGAEDISDSNWPEGSYIHNIAVNPVNADEVLVVMSNYNITGTYHTTNGGTTWTAVEGNLTGTNSNPGPSIRSATIIPAESGTIYILGTSTGLYSTQTLEGANTTWGQEAMDDIGFAVTEFVASRSSNGDIAAGTHGRGAFLGSFQGNTSLPSISATPGEGQPGNVITISANNFQFNTNPSENKVTFGGQPAEVTETNPSSIKTIVPRDAVSRDAPTNSVSLRVATDEQTVSTSFSIQPPKDFALKQNYPNPFNPSTTIPFDVPEERGVIIQLFDINGREILPRPLDGKIYNAGTYDVTIDLSNLASGVYFYRILALPLEGNTGEPLIETKKMTLIK